MKKFISGKLYDTDTAHEIAYREHGESSSDFHYYIETLFRKRTGEYFLLGKGGPMSPYARTVGQQSWMGGEQIKPLTPKMAQEWGEENMDADDYQAEFGPVSEDGGRTTLSISLNAATADRIRKEAQGKGLSVSALIASKF